MRREHIVRPKVLTQAFSYDFHACMKEVQKRPCALLYGASFASFDFLAVPLFDTINVNIPSSDRASRIRYPPFYVQYGNVGFSFKIEVVNNK